MQENPGPQVPYGAQYPYPPAPPSPPRSWFLPMPSGTRFDHLARNEVARPWRAIVGTLALAALFLIVATVVLSAGAVVAVILGIPAPLDVNTGLFGDPVFGMVVMLLSIAAVLPFVFGLAALVQRRRPGTLSSVAGRLRWTWLATCAGLALLALVAGQTVQVLALAVSGEGYADMFGWVGWERFLPALIVIVLLVPFQAAAEEYIFRGWFLQAVGAHVRNPVWGILIGAALFASLHGYSWTGLADVFAFGAVMGWLAVRTGGLEAAIALHVMNNMLAFGLSAAAGTLDDALIQSKVVVPWQALVGVVVQFGLYAFGVLYLAKKRSVGTISG
ncbi:CPBP family intramembrane glutamic endopeptidase [Nonomuraea sp. SYSU D8015]|uniref:CPBP family intramembrane glutamic endopeptidase n=1 Tax=Nonomuraea sp. SYSU D8015 TaxID=2593644 RepID=UPI0016606EC2|nr:type II CAAX endopeptidase family protein [Nonomuraea sp. SYSU D8015]